MTLAQKHLINRLLRSCFMRKSINANGAPIYRLYDEKVNPLRSYRPASVDAIGRHALYEIFKKDKLGRVTLNLSSVRRLHGKSYLKQAYKKIRG